MNDQTASPLDPQNTPSSGVNPPDGVNQISSEPANSFSVPVGQEPPPPVPAPTEPKQEVFASSIPDMDVAPPPPSVMASGNTEALNQPPPPAEPVNMEESGKAVNGKKSNGMVKKLLFIVGGLILLLGLIFAVIKFILPRFGSGTSSNKQVTITWWGLWEDQSVVAPLISEYQQSHPNVTINFVKQSPQDYRERLTNSLAKGSGPDIFRFHNSWAPMFREDLDLVPANVMNAEEYSKTFYPVMVSDLSVGTGFVGIPLMYDGLALYVNEEMFAEFGKTPPTTWDELRETALALTIKDETGAIKRSGVALGRTENVDHWQEILGLMMLQNGVKMTDPQGKNAEDALAYFNVFSSTDKVWDNTLPPSTIAFSSGKLAMYLGPSWRVFEIKEQNPNLKFKIYPVPQLPKASSQDPDIAYATYWVEGVWKRSENKDVAWDFLKFLSSKESLQKMYTEQARTRLFGEPYPRTDMASLLTTDPYAASFIAQAPYAKSWYLASRTYDGQTGINSQINKYFEDAVNGLNQRKNVADVLATVAKGVNQVLSNYGLVSSPQTQ